MKPLFKISGKKIEGKELSNEELKQWSFESRPGGWIIATRGKERLRLHYQSKKNNFWAKIKGQNFFGEKIVQARAGAAQTASDLTAQFPGKVRKILVAAEQKVEANVPLIMVEAMKMEFAIKAPAAGKVKKVLVTEGQQLTPGQQLVDFEEAK